MPLPAKRRALIAWVNCLEIGSIEQIEDIWDPNILTRLAHLVKQKADPLQDLSSLKSTADCLAFICNAVKECREFKVKLDSLVSLLVLEDEQHPDLAMEIAKFLAFLVGWFVSDSDVQKALMKLDVDIQHELLAILELFASESDCLRDELEILLLKDSTGPLVPQTPSPAPPLCPNTPKNTSTLNSNFFEYIATPMKDFFERNQAYRQHRLHRAEIDREELEMELESVREEMSKERAKLFQLEDQVERQRELLHHDQPSPSDKLVRKLESRTMSLNRMNKLCDELEEEKTFLQERVDEMTKENEVLEEKFESRMLDFETQKKELNNMVCEAKEKESEQASMMKEYEALLVEAQHQREDLQQRLEIQLSKSAAFAEKVCTCNCSGDIMSNVLQIEELKTEISRINAENEKFSRVILEKDSIIEAEKNRIDMLLGERGSLECRLSEVEDKNLELHQRVSRVTQDNEDLEIRNSIAVKKTDDLSNQISGLQDEKKQLCAKLYELEQKVDGMLQELTSLEEEKERLMYNTDGHKAEREKLSCFVSQLQEDNDKLVQELSAVSLEKEQLVGEHGMLKQNFRNLQEQMKSSSLQVTELKEEKERAMKYTSCVEVKNAALFGQISDLQNKNDCMTMQLFETSQEMHHIQNCVGVLQQERNGLERSKEDLMGQVNCLNGTLVGLQVQVSESQSEVGRLHKELLAANDSCKLLGAQVTELQRGQQEPLIKGVFLRSELKGMLNALDEKRGFEINNSELEDQITLSNQLVEPRIEDDYAQGRSTKMQENQDLKRSYSIFLKETEDSSSQASQADDEGQELLQERSKFEQDGERLFHDVHELEPETQQLPVMVASHEDGRQQLELCLTKKNEVHVCGNNRQDYLDNSSCLVSELDEGAHGVIDEASIHCSENVTIPPAEGYTQTKDDASTPDETSKLQKESDLSQQPCIVEEEQQSNHCHLLRLYKENHLKNNLSSNDDETIDGVQSRVELDIEQAHLRTSLSSPPESIAEQGNVISVLKTVGTEMLQASSLKEDLETRLAGFIKEKDTNENQKLVLQEQNMEFCAKISSLMQEKQELEASNRKLGEKNENSRNLVSRLQMEQQEMIVKMSLFQEEGDGLLRDVSTFKKNNQDVLRKIDELLEEKTMCEGQISMLTIENRNLKEKLSTFNKIKNLHMVELGTQTTFHNDDPEPLPAPSDIKELQLQQLKKQVDKASECCRVKSKLAQDLTACLGERERELMERDRELTTVREASKASEHRSKAKQHMLVETIRSLKSQLDFADKRAQQLDGAPQSNARRVTPSVPQDHMTVPLPVQTRPPALKRKLNDDCANLFLDKTVKVKAGTYLNEVTAIKAKAAMDSSRDSLESSLSIIPSPESHAQTAGDLSFELCSGENMLDEGEVQEYEFFRIAELQRRNRRCLPHMKSSYPAETQTYCKDATDEQMKTGDPTEMIQRTSLVSDSRPNDTQRTSLNIGAGPRRHTMAPTDFMQRPRAPRVAPGRQHQYCRSKPTPQSSFGGVLLGREPRSNVQHKRAADPQTLYEDEEFGINHHSIPEEASPEQICRRQSIAFKIDNTPPRQPSRRPLRPVPNRGQRPVPNRGPGSILQAINQVPRGNSSKR